MNRLAVTVFLCALSFAHSVPLQHDSRPSNKDMELVRESWKTKISKNSKIPVSTLLQVIKANPEMKEASPVFKDISMEDLPKTSVFLKRAFFLYGHLMNFVVNVMDNEAVLRDSLRRLETVGRLYAPGMANKDKHNRFYLLELEREEPNMTLETRQAWSNCLNYVISFLSRDEPHNSISDGTSVYSKMAQSFIIMASSALLFLVGSTAETLSAPSSPNEQEIVQNNMEMVLTRLNHLEVELEKATLKLMANNKSNKIVYVDGRAVLWPRSCRDLAGNGQNIDGIYLIEWPGSNLKRIGAVHCEFAPGNPAVETLIGMVDIKSSSVQFYVQWSTTYGRANTVIPWRVTRLNFGNAMNATSGVFTAPKEGVHHLQFSAPGARSQILIRLNGENIGRIAHDVQEYDDGTIQTTLRLTQSDKIDLYMKDGTLLDNLCYFTGRLDEE